MSATASWIRKYWLELLWGLFAAVNLVVLMGLVAFETVPFHFVWVSLTLVYGYRMWQLRSTLYTLLGVCVATAFALGWVVTRGPQGVDELTEVPLMGAMFLAMVWHTERRRAAVEDVRRAAEREHAFVRDASHQLRTPITIARAHAELLRNGSGPSHDDLNILTEELSRLSTVAEGLLILASTQEFDSLVRTTIDPTDVIDCAGRRWTVSAERQWRFECDAAGTLSADRLRLDSALDALIENAVQATETGGRISVLCRAEGGYAVLEVSDSGIGIPEQFLPRVFDRFWSMRDVEAGVPRRTGLGLAIVKAIVEAHGGSVAVKSVVGVGTMFSMWIPGFEALTSARSSRELLGRKPAKMPETASRQRELV